MKHGPRHRVYLATARIDDSVEDESGAANRATHSMTCPARGLKRARFSVSDSWPQPSYRCACRAKLSVLPPSS
jgi:hypothetical protein